MLIRINFYVFLLCVSTFLTALVFEIQAQFLGGQQSFSFLKFPAHAQIAALGGVNISLRNSNVNLFTSNPALLNTEMHKHGSISYVPYYAGVRYSTLAYGHEFEKAGTWGVALQYMNYGSFEETDATGAVIGNFSANDFVFTTSHSRTSGPYTIGVSMKLVGSTLANYNAYGLLFDIGGLFKHPVHDFTVGLAIKNVGLALDTYTPDGKLTMPFEVQLGTSFKPKFMP